MKNEFIPYEQALELKELGFDEPCFAFYGIDGSYLIGIDEVRFDTINNYDFNSRISEQSNSCSAPLYQQAFRWFRKNHVFYINSTTADIFYFVYCFKVHPYDPMDSFISKFFETYEETEFELLKKLIEFSTKKPEGGQIWPL